MSLKIVKSLTLHENIAQNLIHQYQKIGFFIFVIGIALSTLGELELIAILFRLPLHLIPKFIPFDVTFFSSIFYLVLGNLIMLIEYQFFREKANAKLVP